MHDDSRGSPRRRRDRSQWIFSDQVSPLTSGRIPRRIEHFELQEVIGEGSMGIVIAAVDARDGSPAAIKILRPELLGSIPEARFARELRILDQLDHPGLARVLGSGTVEVRGGRLPWIALERIDGEELIEDADRRGLDRTARLEQLRLVADAVGFAHSRGFVHRDLKPENIRVDGGGRPRVLDFGIAAVLTGIAGGSWEPLTGSGELLGTFELLSPEQVAGEEVGPPSDVYSLGVIGGLLLVGHTPYKADSAMVPQLLIEIRGGALGGIRAWLEALPPPVFSLLMRCVSREPEDRPKDGAALAEELGALIAG